MRKCKKIIGIVLIIILSFFVIVKSYATDTITYTGSLEDINKVIKTHLDSVNCPLSAKFEGKASRTIEWSNTLSGTVYKYKASITVVYTDRGLRGMYDMTMTISIKNKATDESVSIEQWQRMTKADTPVDHTAGEIIDESKNFIEMGENAGSPGISPENLQKLSTTIYNILLVVGIALAVVIAAILGIKFITGGIEAQVDVKKALVPYIAGCVVIFGAFIIWKIVLQILNSM